MPVLRDDPAQHDLVTPRDLAEALTLLADGQSRPLSGGTDLMVLLAAGKLPPRRYVNLWALPELRGIQVSDEGVQLGGLTTYREVQRHPLLRDQYLTTGSFISFPLIYRDELIGVVNLTNRAKRGVFVEEDVERVSLLALVIALIAANADLPDRLLGEIGGN